MAVVMTRNKKIQKAKKKDRKLQLKRTMEHGLEKVGGRKNSKTYLEHEMLGGGERHPCTKEGKLQENET